MGVFLAEKVAPFFDICRIFFAEQKHNSLPMLADNGNRLRQNDLRMFIYGGSLSSYLMGKNSRYAPLALGQDSDLPPTMDLRIVAPAEYVNPLKLYHQALYGDALDEDDHDKNDQCPPFFTVYRGYNDLAWLLQHRSSFKNASAFAHCLRDHHITGSQLDAQVAELVENL
ncbi:MAG: hypothetical protein E7812_00830 [Phenylobacterium sp.]|nr:MAG: hypothetical protein E7812_00830 [Phenylobacterium sp.]